MSKQVSCDLMSDKGIIIQVFLGILSIGSLISKLISQEVDRGALEKTEHFPIGHFQVSSLVVYPPYFQRFYFEVSSWKENGKPKHPG